MDNRAAKLANARKKLRDHQEKKSGNVHKDEASDTLSSCGTPTYKNDEDQTVFSKNDDYLTSDHINDGKTDDVGLKIEQFNCYSNSHNDSVTTNEKSFASVTEILISNKTDLEMQNKELQSKISQLEHILSNQASEHNLKNLKLSALERELNEARKQQSIYIESTDTQATMIDRLTDQVKILTEDKNSLIEQQEFTKSMLTAKELEVAQLHNHVYALQNQVDVTTLQLQQLTSDTNIKLEPRYEEEINLLNNKIALLENELGNSLKEKDHINGHYEHYVNRLNEQIQNLSIKNELLSDDVKNLSNRESALIEQISQLEIRMQNYRRQSELYAESHKSSCIEELRDKVASLQAELDGLNNKYSELQKQYEKSVITIQELNETKVQEFAHDNISITKLNADIASDKIAAQRATEQNKKLKTDIENLEQIVVKLGKDKLELTEKLSHENQLNKQLILKLAEIDETSKEVHTKLIAKDEEMIRLQASYRDIESKHEKLLEELLQSKEDVVSAISKYNVDGAVELKSNGVENEEKHLDNETNDFTEECALHAHKEIKNSDKILKEDAMHKLQERFLNIMDQVANLSDEKHRLEHIILQLQTETDTICEYVALYQQQRSLLKKRDEERSAQIKLFQMECDEVKRQLEELNELFLKLAQDKELYPHLQIESRSNDIAKIKKLLENLLNSSLINSKCKSLELKNFYPCNCCSGQLIDV